MASREDPPADRLDGYTPHELPSSAPETDPVFLSEAEREAAYLAELTGRFDNLDGFRNELTGIGDPDRDKVLGGSSGTQKFMVRFLAGTECEDRWRGSDLGGRIIETVPDEMTREWWDTTIQLTDDADDASDADDPASKKKSRWDWLKRIIPWWRRDGMLPEIDDETPAIVEALETEDRELETQAMVREALCYERAYGGGACFIGADDGEKDLTRPLNERNLKRITHLTPFRGGWDGELIAWRYYNDMTKKKYGRPEVYMLRNLGVPLVSTPAPGETRPPQQIIPSYPTGSLIAYIHESRLLIFPGQAVSHRARVQMRGWGDSVFTRVDEVLSQYGQTWGSLANLMTDWAQGVLKMKGLSLMLAKAGVKGRTTVAERMLAINMSRSIARTMLIDSEEEFKREVAPLTGIADVLGQFDLRLAAASDMPVSMLMGQVKGGLGDAGNTDLRFFYDKVRSRQIMRLAPQLRRLRQLQFIAKFGPTKGRAPKRWNLAPRRLWQPTEAETVDMRNKQQQTDVGYIQAQVYTPEEVAASRFGGSTYSIETTIDFEGRAQMAAIAGAAGAPPAPGTPPTPGGATPAQPPPALPEETRGAQPALPPAPGAEQGPPPAPGSSGPSRSAAGFDRTQGPSGT